MRNLYRSLCLAALLAVAPTVLIGCSGGSSSTNSSTTTRANLNYSFGSESNVINAGKVRGVFKPKTETEGIPDYTVGSGVYSYYNPFPNQPVGTGALVNNVVVNNSAENRVLTIERLTRTGDEEAVGTTYDLATQNPPIGIRLERNFRTGTAPFGAFYLADRGTLTVTSIKGNFVTFEVRNVLLSATTVDANPAQMFLNGTITYNRNDVVLYDTSNLILSEAFKNQVFKTKALKNSSNQ